MVLHMAWRTNTGGEKRTITLVCLRSTWGSSLWQAQREDKFHKHDMKKLCTHLTTSKEILIALFQRKKQPLLFLEHRRKSMPAFQQHSSPLSFPWTTWQPHFSLSPGWLPVREGIAGVKEGRPWPLRKAHGVCSSWCVQLTAAQLTSAHCPLTSLMAESAVSISTPHWAPAPKLSPLAPCPGIEKHPQTHPCAKKHLPGFPHHSLRCKGGSPLPWRRGSLGRSCPCLPGWKSSLSRSSHLCFPKALKP